MTKQQKIQRYFNQKNRLTLQNRDYLQQVKTLTNFFLQADLQNKGDITTDILIKQNQKATSQIIANETGTLAGVEEVKWLAKNYQLLITNYKKDGLRIKKGDSLLTLKGNVKNILKTERTILNILQRMSGIATQTAKLVKKTKNQVLICPTRKTQWGLLDKKAVTIGGGGTHRLGLYDWILIKDNHLSEFQISPQRRGPVICGADFRFQIDEIKKQNLFLEIEADDAEQALEFSKLDPDAIMFDNFSPTQIKKIIPKLNPKIIFEASGGIDEANIVAYAKSGVDIVSLGALTHSAKALDIGMAVS